MILELGRIISDPMKLALVLAEEGKYTVSPNPMVGAVLLKKGKLVGYGYHLYKGDKHAEVKAIKMAGRNSITLFGNDIGVSFINEAKQAKFETIERIGEDFLISANLK